MGRTVDRRLPIFAYNVVPSNYRSHFLCRVYYGRKMLSGQKMRQKVALNFTLTHAPKNETWEPGKSVEKRTRSRTRSRMRSWKENEDKKAFHMRRTPQPQICKFVPRTGKPGILSSDGMLNFEPVLTWPTLMRQSWHYHGPKSQLETKTTCQNVNVHEAKTWVG